MIDHIGVQVTNLETSVVAMTEPAVIDHEEFDPEWRRLFGQLHETILVERKIGRFPIVDENGTHGITKASTAESRAVEPVVIPRHPAEPVSGINENRFRSLKRLTWLELPAEPGGPLPAGGGQALAQPGVRGNPGHRLAQLWRVDQEGGAREIPFTLDPSVPAPVDGAPGSASVRLGAQDDRQTPLESWLSLLFGPGN